MSYVLNQFNQSKTNLSDATSEENLNYLTPISGGTAKRRKAASADGVTDSSQNIFLDECVQMSSSLVYGENYYFHAKIKKLDDEQVFYLYLVNFKESGSISEEKTQYLKTIKVPGGLEDEWVDFELIFSPLQAFDCILFQLQRTIKDYNENTKRYPYIVYEELSKINNIIPKKIKNGASLIKMGIQSRPGLMMCLNGEEIHVGRSGIYEVRNGVIFVNFLSMVSAATENKVTADDGKVYQTLKDYLKSLSDTPVVTVETSTNSKCIFGNSKLRSIDAFTLDYMYEEA